MARFSREISLNFPTRTNYRWNFNGYNPSQISQGDWDSIVVPVPADFALKGSKIGIEVATAGKGTITIYVDAISFND